MLGYLLTSVVVGLVYPLLLSVVPWLASTAGFASVQSAVGILVFGGLTWSIGRRLLRLSRRELGWAAPRVGIRGFGRGFALGAGIAATALVTGVVLGVAAWVPDGGTFAAWAARLPTLAIVLLPAAFMEELAFRGVGFAGLARAGGPGVALLATALLFAATHAANPGATTLGMGNVALAGILLGLTFLARGGLWTATGAHLGWNFVLAGLDAPVSGLPFEIPWIDFRPGSAGWLTGGPFGPEGGVLATVALVLGIAVAARWRTTTEEA